MSAKIIRGGPIADEIRREVAEGVAEMQAKHGVTPGIGVLLAGDDPASAVYVRLKRKAAEEAGMASEVVRLPAGASQDEALAVVRRMNADARVHGILAQMPLPKHIDEDAVIEAIDPDKDVDGLHPFNMGLLMAGKPVFVPATPGGVQRMLIRSGFDPAGKNAVILGRSNIVGKPLANLLMQRADGANATVTICHTRTRNLAEIARRADILIAAIGQPRFVTADMVGDGAVVIDVGVNRIAAPERESGFRLVGDVDFAAVREKAAAISPVPGGVGPMTIATLLRNTLKAARIRVHPHLRHAPDG